MTTGCGSLFLQGGRYRERDMIKELTRGSGGHVLEKAGQQATVGTSAIFTLQKF